MNYLKNNKINKKLLKIKKEYNHLLQRLKNKSLCHAGRPINGKIDFLKKTNGVNFKICFFFFCVFLIFKILK